MQKEILCREGMPTIGLVDGSCDAGRPQPQVTRTRYAFWVNDQPHFCVAQLCARRLTRRIIRRPWLSAQTTVDTKSDVSACKTPRALNRSRRACGGCAATAGLVTVGLPDGYRLVGRVGCWIFAVANNCCFCVKQIYIYIYIYQLHYGDVCLQPAWTCPSSSTTATL